LQKIEILFHKIVKYKFKPKNCKKKMSSRNQSVNQSANRSKSTKKFCKVCFDAGKTEAEYVSHYVRDSIGGAVVCPTILNQQCNYCKKQGHTPSHCPELEGKYIKQTHTQAKQVQAKQVQAKQAQAKQVQAKQAHKQPQTQLQARAARLCESPPPFEDKINENFPILGQVDSGKIIRPVPVKFNVWAAIAAKPPSMKAPIAEVPIAEVPIAVEPIEEPIAEEPIEELQITLEDVEETIVIESLDIEEAHIESYIPTPVMSWADM